jgi:hypothetical protein
LEIDILRVIIAIFLIFFLPGFFLVQALFPKKNELDEEDDLLYRIALGIALSIIITTLDGFILGSMGINPATGKGYWDTPYIFGSLIGISIVLFIIGWYRGAYPILGRRPADEVPIRISDKDKREFYTLMNKWKKLQKQVEKYNEIIQDEDFKNREKYESKIAELTKELNELEAKLVQLGHKEMPIIKAKEKKILDRGSSNK